VSYELNERARRVQNRFEIPVLVAALLVVPVVLIEERGNSSMLLSAAAIANWAIWAAFLTEYVTVVSMADDRWACTRQAWLDVCIILVSFPLMPALFASTRLMRLTRLSRVFRLLRLARLAAVLSRGGKAARAVFGSHGVGYLLILTGFLAFGFGGLYAYAEGAGFVDGVWWAFVTLTTVGYGDAFPVTALGRFAGVGLMLVGIGFVAVLTAAVAARFVEDEEQDVHGEVLRLHERLDAIEALLRQQAVKERS
jgi:voltage-gated potassium channel